jgi:putative transposase
VDGSETALRDQIEQLILEFPGSGYRRVTRALQLAGWKVNHKRVLRIRREESLLCHLKKRFVIVTTNSRHGFPVYPNLLAETQLSAPNQAWVADLTYIRLRAALVYLACILDAFSRRCVGWALSREMTTQLTLAALRQAIAQRQPGPGLIHHRDRGGQYASHDYVAQLQAIGVQISMSAVGNPYDHAKGESFLKTLKTVEVYLKEYESFADAEANLQDSLNRCIIPKGCTPAWDISRLLCLRQRMPRLPEVDFLLCPAKLGSLQ